MTEGAVGAVDTAGAPVGGVRSGLLALPGYRRLFLAGMVVIFGVMSQAVGRAWLAYEITGSNTGLGGVMVVFGVGLLLVTPWAGVATDRFPKRSVLLLGVIGLAATSAWIAIALLLDVVTYWMLLVAGGLQAGAFGLYTPARLAMIPEVVADSQVSRAVVISQMSHEVARIGGPAVAGILISVSWFGATGLFVFAASLSLVSCGFVLRLPRGAPAPSAGGQRPTPLAELRAGLAHLTESRSLGLVAVTSIAVILVGHPYLTFLPTLADETFGQGSAGYGAMWAAVGAGALIAGFAVVRPLRNVDPWCAMSFGGLSFGACLVLLSTVGQYWAALLVLAGVGAGGLLFQTSSVTLLFKYSDRSFHGRVQGVVAMGISGFAVAALPLGLLADAITLRLTLRMMGLVVMTALVVFGVHRRSVTR